MAESGSGARRLISILATVAILGAAAALHFLTAEPARVLLGYSPAASAVEAAWEQKFRALPQPGNIRANMQLLSAFPHNVGTERQRQNAQWLLHQFQSFGFDAHIEQFSVLYPTPTQRQVELVTPVHYQAVLQEPPIAQDPTSGQAGQLPTFVMYSADGDVTAPLVYANYGLPDDYDQLDKLGISVKGKIVITRYGGGWRGIKPKVAYQHGAVGCLIYSDPRDDGFFKGDVFPQGPYRPEQGVQRGSVMQMEVSPGDPETPGWGSVEGAKRLPLDQVQTLQKIPVMPLSYGDALPLLKALDGPVAPEGWRGALPITYHIGPGAATVHLAVKFNWGHASIYDVIATIPGSAYPDQWVIRGNHFDAWVNGADDPISGQSALLEEARSLGELLKQGWRPQRTIVYAAWDGEEPALLGSTEFAETHAAELQQKAVAYFNSDSNGKGYLDLGGSHTLEHFLNQVADDVTDPQTGQSVLARALQHRDELAKTPQQKSEVRDGADLKIAALGSGSDYSPFLQHLGIPSVNFGFSGQSGGGVYHSVYDDFYWYTHFSDTNFVYGRALAQTVGSAVMRIADAPLLPLQFSDLGDNLELYQTQIEATYRSQSGAPAFDFSPLEQAVIRFRAAAADFDQAAAEDSAFFSQPAFERDAVNQLLLSSERQLLDPAGLPRRPWYQHQIYAPGFYTGYGVKTLPGLREAIEQKDYAEAAREQAVIVRSLDALTRQVALARSKM